MNAHDRHVRLLVITALIGAIAVAVVLVLYFRHRGGPGSSGYVTLAATRPPLVPIRMADAGGELFPLTVDGQGTAVLVDAASSATSGYFLIADPLFAHAELYRRESQGGNAALAQLTHSQTIKYDLSYDALSSAAAYVSASTTASAGHVTYWSPLDGKEKDLGVGSDPSLLSGGFFVIARSGDSLVSVSTQTGARSTLLALPGNAPFAVDREHATITIYEPTHKEYQTFSVAGMTSASYVASSPAPVTPLALTYDQGALVSVVVDPTTRKVTEMINGKAFLQWETTDAKAWTGKFEIHHD